MAVGPGRARDAGVGRRGRPPLGCRAVLLAHPASANSCLADIGVGRGGLRRGAAVVITPGMAIDLYSFVDLYDRQLGSLSHLLDKGEAHLVARGEDPAAMLDWRLADDMHPLRFQAMVVIVFALRWTARVAGLAEPEAIGADLDLAGFRAAIQDARAALAALPREAFAGRDDAELFFQINETIAATQPAGQWLSVFATGNIYFHLSMVYAILRARGVGIGKFDFFAGRI